MVNQQVQGQRKRPRRGILFSLSAAAALLLAGCGGGNVARPTGRIVDRGVPVERAAIVFAGAIDGREIRVSGLTDADGRYRLDYGVHDGVPVGPMQVTIGRTVLRDGSPAPPGEEGMHMVQTGAARVRTYEYQVDIAPGSPQLDFDLAEGDDRVPR